MGTRNQQREQVAREAARIMIESGVRDYQLAKRKACERLRLDVRRNLPSNHEIENALREYQRLFRAHTQPRALFNLRRAAISAMRFLSRFDPRLVGPVLAGTADEYSRVSLHLFSEPAEAVGLFLMDHGIPHRLSESRVRVSSDEFRRYPVYNFVADDVPVELLVFQLGARKHAPLSPVDGRPMARATVRQVEELAAAESQMTPS